VFRQGSLFCLILLSSPGASSSVDVRLIQQLAAKQASRAPRGRTAPVGWAQLAVRFSLGSLVALLAYVGLGSLVAWTRDPLRRSLRSRAPLAGMPRAPGGGGVVDVPSEARRRRRRARLGLVLQLVGVVVAVTGLLPLLDYLAYGQFFQAPPGLGLG